jgi:hypothetical protein
MNLTKIASKDNSQLYYFEKYLRYNFLQYSITIQTQKTNLIQSINFLSNDLGICYWTLDSGFVGASAWEDEDEVQRVSALSKHYTNQLAIKQMNEDFGIRVVKDILASTSDNYIKDICQKFCFNREKITFKSYKYSVVPALPSQKQKIEYVPFHKTCKKCGGLIFRNSIFCTKCGKRQGVHLFVKFIKKNWKTGHAFFK